MCGTRQAANLVHKTRWRRFAAVSTVSGVGIAFGTLYAAHSETGPNLSESSLKAIPLNAIGIAAHYVSKIPIPTSVRPALYGKYCSIVGCDITESNNLAQFRSLAEFFARPHKLGTRPIDANAALVVPCDGQVIAAGPVGSYGAINVKGIRYHIRDLVGAEEREPLAVSSVAVAERKESGSRLWFTAIHIKPNNCHRFFSPTNWTVNERRHIGGYLLWMRPKTEGLYSQNERVAFLGSWDHGMFSVTAVGAAGRGSISVDVDENDRETFTPQLRPRLGAVTKRRFMGGRELRPGQGIGHFLLGSAVVLVFEAPERDFKFCAQPGDHVKAGQKLAEMSSGKIDTPKAPSSKLSQRDTKAGSRARFRRAW